MSIIPMDSQLFTLGRAGCAAPLAIVLHEYRSGIEMLDAEMDRCPRPRPAQSPGCHTSFHYGIDACTVHQYVQATDTAWGFGVTPPSCPAPQCPPDECESCTGLTVAQYNPDLNGVAPVLPAFVAGPDGTANSCVLHVAITGSATDSYGCCKFLSEPKTYACVVKSMAAIFTANGLIPDASTLLVHCGELPCLDITQFINDIITVMNAPVPGPYPCNCTATSVTINAVQEVLAQFGSSPIPATTALGDDLLFHPITGGGGGAPTPAEVCTALEGLPTSTFTPTSFVYGFDGTQCVRFDIGQPMFNTTDCQGNQIALGDAQVVTKNDINTAATISPVPSLLALDGIGGCPVQLQPTTCDGPTVVEDQFDHLSLQTDGNLIFWGRKSTSYVRAVSAGVLTSVEYQQAHIFIADSGPIDLANPGPCDPQDIWVKNVSGGPIDVRSLGSTIDGNSTIILQGQVPNRYPFRNNGGESVHLAWLALTNSWYVI